MKQFRVQPGGGLASLVQHEAARPRPASHQILIRVLASSVNYREENIIVHNRYPLPLKSDLVPLCDGAGVVAEIGADVSSVAPGDRVSLVVFPQWQRGRFTIAQAAQLGGSLDGTLTEFIVADADAVVPTPSHLSDLEGATLPCAALTAWNGLTGGRAMLPGETVLTLGSGSVALFAIQFAKAHGGRVIATTSTAEKAAVLARAGADHVIDYVATPGWNDAVREMTGGAGVDHIIETGRDGTFERSVKALAFGGEIALIGNRPPEAGNVTAADLFRGGVNIRPIAIGNREQHLAMNRFIEERRIKPVIDSVFEFSDAARALERAMDGDRRIGKVVIDHSSLSTI